MPASKRQEVEIGGRRLAVGNLDKVLYPAVGFTKAHVLDYYLRIAEVALPHLRGRPLTMKRYPDGVDGESFFEKRCPDHAPEWVTSVRLPGSRADKDVDHCTVDEVATLAWVANLASLELHTSLGRRPEVARPTLVVFDLDPGEPADVVDCARVAGWLREVLDRLGLAAFPKTSGGKGLQAYVPVNLPVDYERTRDFALAVAAYVEREHPEAVVTNMRKDLRRGKVLIDWSQNHLHKTTVSVYSLRARGRPTVSAPVTWDEVDEVAASGEPTRFAFEAADVLRRVEERGDLFATVETLQQPLPDIG